MLAELLAQAANGVMPVPGGGPTILPQPAPRDAGVIAFTAHNVIFADVDPDWISGHLPGDDLSAPLNPPFLGALEKKTGRRVDNVDMLALAVPLEGGVPVALREITDSGHPRVERARSHRDDVRVWTGEAGVVVLGRGVAGRWEEIGRAHV